MAEYYDDGIDGKAFNFDGTTTVQINSGLVSTNDEYTITAWVKKASGDIGAEEAVYAEEYSGSGTETKLMYWGNEFSNDGNVELRIFQRDSSSGAGGDHNKKIDSGVPITDTNWHHLAWVQTNRTSYDVYVDGSKIKTVDGLSFSGSFRADINNIGSRPDDTQNYQGQIDEVRTYEKALTPDEILADMGPIAMLDQPSYALEHSGVLTIIDRTISSDEITARVISNTGSATEPIDITLDRDQYPEPFTSEFINFTKNGLTDETSPPQLKVDVGSSLDVVYDGRTFRSIASIVESDNSLPKWYGLTKNYGNQTSCSVGDDSDNDRICDSWESSLIINEPPGSDYQIPCDEDIDYQHDPLGSKVCPKIGVKDIYVEIDYMAGHYPNIESLERVVESFANAPEDLDNPFALHLVIDEEILPHIDEIATAGTNQSFDQIKAEEFGTDSERTNNWSNNEKAKNHIFRYCIWAHDQAGAVGDSGKAEQRGNDCIITLGSFDGAVGNMDQQAGTFMHELGHTIGLNHGGRHYESDTCKPNLLSVMSYPRQFNDLVNNRALDYSRDPVGEYQGDITNLGDEANLESSTIGVSEYPDQPDAQIVFGNGSGTIEVVGVNQASVDWPDRWQDIRYIRDLDGKDIGCDEPATSIELTSVNQWEEIDLIYRGGHWYEGRSGGDNSAENNSGVNSFSNINATVSTTSDTRIVLSNIIKTSPQNLAEELGDVAVFVKDGSWVPGCENTDGCYVPSSLRVDIGTTVTWYNSDAKPHSISIRQGEFNNYYFPPGDIFKHTFYNSGTFDYFCEFHPWMEGTVVVGPKVNGEPPSGNEPVWNMLGQWCLSREQAEIQANKTGLDMEFAPLCSNPNETSENELNIANVIAARTVNADNVNNLIKKLNPARDLENPSDMGELIQEYQDIRKHIQKNQMAEALEGYMALRSSVDEKVINEEAKIKLLATIDRNIESASYAVPEFETVVFMILAVTIGGLVALSRASPFNSKVYTKF